MGIFHNFIARQLAKPRGWFGRFYMADRLNRINARMNEVTLKHLNPKPGDRILEVGFGGGQLLEKILSQSNAPLVAGIDLSAEMVSVVGKRLRSFVSSGLLELKQGDIETLPESDQAFTKVCTVNTLYFWERPERALAELSRVLVPNGMLVLCFNSKEDLGRRFNLEHGFRLYEVSEVQDLLVVAGFVQLKVSTVDDLDGSPFYCVTAFKS